MDVRFEPAHLAFLEQNTAQQRWHYMDLHRDGNELVDNICRFLVPAMRPGHAGIMVATEERIHQVRQRASSFGLNLREAEAMGQFMAWDARALLDRFMVDGLPDRSRFTLLMTELLTKIARKHPKLHIYGEMVAMLLEDGNVKATEILENLWNNLGRLRPFALLCGYPRAMFGDPGQAALLERICNCHTKVYGLEPPVA